MSRTFMRVARPLLIALALAQGLAIVRCTP